MARYLYTLMMMLRSVGTGALSPFPYPYTETTLSSSQVLELDTRRIAQWSINAVTFATNDSVMVPFKYDPNVLTNVGGSYGWHLQDDNIKPKVLGDLTTSQDTGASFGVVWGCKPPELLLTEAVAFHNRRVADTAYASGLNGNNRFTASANGTSAMPKVPYLQQTRVPQGSLFVELYCPRSPTNQAPPSAAPASGPPAVRLLRLLGRDLLVSEPERRDARKREHEHPGVSGLADRRREEQYLECARQQPNDLGDVNDLRSRLYNALTGQPDSTSMETEQWDQNGGDTWRGPAFSIPPSTAFLRRRTSRSTGSCGFRPRRRCRSRRATRAISTAISSTTTRPITIRGQGETGFGAGSISSSARGP